MQSFLVVRETEEKKDRGNQTASGVLDIRVPLDRYHGRPSLCSREV